MSSSEQMIERVQNMWEVFCGELTQEPTDEMKKAFATALRSFSNSMNKYPKIFYKIADELDGGN